MRANAVLDIALLFTSDNFIAILLLIQQEQQLKKPLYFYSQAQRPYESVTKTELFKKRFTYWKSLKTPALWLMVIVTLSNFSHSYCGRKTFHPFPRSVNGPYFQFLATHHNIGGNSNQEPLCLGLIVIPGNFVPKKLHIGPGILFSS